MSIAQWVICECSAVLVSIIYARAVYTVWDIFEVLL